MFKHYSAKNLLGILFLFICSSFLNAQNNGNQQEDGFNIDLSDVFGGFYYTDPLSVQLASRINPIEASLDLENYVLGVNDLISIKIDGAQSLFLRGILVNLCLPIWSLPILNTARRPSVSGSCRKAPFQRSPATTPCCTTAC